MLAAIFKFEASEILDGGEAASDNPLNGVADAAPPAAPAAPLLDDIFIARGGLPVSILCAALSGDRLVPLQPVQREDVVDFSETEASQDDILKRNEMQHYV